MGWIHRDRRRRRLRPKPCTLIALRRMIVSRSIGRCGCMNGCPCGTAHGNAARLGHLASVFSRHFERIPNATSDDFFFSLSLVLARNFKLASRVSTPFDSPNLPARLRNASWTFLVASLRSVVIAWWTGGTELD